MQLLDHLADVAGTDCNLVFLDEREDVPFGSLWDRAGMAAATLDAHSGGGTVAMLLESGQDCIATFLGALRAGLRVLSLPLPPRGGRSDWYLEYLMRVCAEADVQVVAVERPHLALIPAGMPFDVLAYDEVVQSRHGLSPDRTGATLVQFTSGSTSDPTGVVLTSAELEANIAGILDVLEPAPGDASVSWLPLSHDMGLVGMLLSSLVAAHPARVGGGSIGLMRPSTFVRSPWRWLQACSEMGATITSAPDFALQLATLASRRVGPVDLSPLRACIVGGEPVRPTTLDAFESAFGTQGFSSRAFCPAYGLAEATLAVTLTPPSTRWHVATLDAAALSAGEIVRAEEGRDLVSSGTPLSGLAVEIEGATLSVRLVVAGL